MYHSAASAIAGALSGRQWVLFVGAGLSMGAGLPSWQELVAPLAEALGATDPADPLDVAQVYEGEFGRADLEATVCALTCSSGKELTEVHALLPSLRSRLWATTNFDDLLERTLKDAGADYRVAVENRDLSARPAAEWMVLKLHGDRGTPSTIRITKHDLYGSCPETEFLWNRLCDRMIDSTALFLGYGMGDPDFTRTLVRLVELIGRECLPTSYAVMLGVDDVSRQALASMNIEVIDLGDRRGAHATTAVADFLCAVIEQLKHYPDFEPEVYDADGARSRVPADIIEMLDRLGRPLFGCVEFHVFSPLVDSGQFVTHPPGWTPWLPPPFDLRTDVPIYYERTDDKSGDRWVGLAVGRCPSPRDGAPPEPG
jgi:hypothetical protein